MRIECSESGEPSASSSTTAPTTSSDMPPASAALLRAILAARSDAEFCQAIDRGREVHAVMGKTELCKWTEVLNRCDGILERATEKNDQGNMLCDCDATVRRQVISIVRFTVLLFECTSSRRIYKSTDRILALLECTNMDLLAEVLRLLQVMGKRSKFLSTRIPQKEQAQLAHHLTAIAQCWGGKLRTVKMAECLKREPKLPPLFVFTYTDSKQRTISVEQPKFQQNETVGELITRTVAQLSPPASSDSVQSSQFSKEDRYCLLSRLRMLISFDDWHHRFKCLIVRLLSVSTLVYCRLGGTDENTIGSLLYIGFVEEIVELLKAERDESLADQHLYDGIQTEALSTLCSIVTYEKEPKIAQILEALSASSYHGFLSVMTRQIVEELKNNNLGKPGKPSVSLATALFSFIYHLASIEPGGDTLVGSGLTQTLLSVIGFHELPIECITFGTRCARIIDLFTTIDVTAFKANNGMEICVNRVVHEVNECRKEQPFMIDTSYDMPFEDDAPEPSQAPPAPAPTPADDEEEQELEEEPVEVQEEPQERPEEEAAAITLGMLHDHQLLHAPEAPPGASPATNTAVVATAESKIKGGPWEQVQIIASTCHQQRSGLIKGLLTFIKRAIGDVQFQDLMKHLMEGDLPDALMHILSNAEYYSPSLFHQSAHLITNFVYQFPEELSSIQRRHVPYVIFQSLLRKELPNSKDVITTLGNVFTAMCLNERGLRQFKSYDPFDQIFRIVLSVKFLVTLRKKRSAEVFESAQAIGGALDDLMRHYPDLKHDMLKSIIVILDLLDDIGRTPPAGVELVPTLTKTMARSVVFATSSLLPREAREEGAQAGGGDEEPMEVEEDSEVDEDDTEMSMDEMSGDAEPPASTPSPPKPSAANKPFEYGAGMMCEDGSGKKILPIGDYMLLIARVVETMMTQSPSQKITEEFIEGGVMQKIMKLCHLPCITSESTHSTYIASIANIIKHIVKAGFQSQRNGPDAGPKLMAAIVGEFVKTINPLFEVNDFSSLKEPTKASLLLQADEKLVEKTLVELNSIIPILLNLNKNPINSSFNPTNDHRNRFLETWKSAEGVKLYGMLRKLSRMLCWEHELVQTLKPTIRTAATQTEGEMLSGEHPVSDSHLDSEILPDDQIEGGEVVQAREARWQSAGVSQEEHDFWAKNKQLQETVTKAHHLTRELLNSMGKQINLVNPRRPRTRGDTPPMPHAATHCISMIFTSIYKDLKWEPVTGALSPMAYGRYIELLSQLNCSLFEANGRCGSPTLAQNFYTSGCHKAFFELFAEKIIPFLGAQMPDGVEQTMEEWCRLAAKLTDRNAIVSLDQTRRERSPDFDTTKYLKLVCRDMFNVYKQFFEKMTQMPDWELRSLKKVCESAFSVFREVAKNLVEENEEQQQQQQQPEPAAAAPAAPAPAAAAPAAPEPNAEQIAMLMDLGFSREIVLYAVENTRNADEAANYLLAHGHDERIQEVVNAFPFRGAASLQLALQQAGAAVEAVAAAVAMPNFDEIEVRLNAHLRELEGIDLVHAAQRVLQDAGVEGGEQLGEVAEGMDAEHVIAEVMERVRNPNPPGGSSGGSSGGKYEENIATPLIPPLSQLKIEQEVSLNSACKQLFPLVKRLLLVSNDSVHPCAELIISIFPAMSSEWRSSHLIGEIIGDELLKMAMEIPKQQSVENEGKITARNFANRLHFCVLIFEKVAEEYMAYVEAHGMIPIMLRALAHLTSQFKAVDYYQSIVTRIICWMDLYSKASRLVRRREYLHKLAPQLEWSYTTFEEDALRRRADFSASGEKKWVAYDAEAQAVINEAFFKGEKTCKCTVKRGTRPNKKVDVDFLSMKQGDGTSRENIKAELPASIDANLEDLMASESSLPIAEEHNDELLQLSVDILKMGALDPKCSHSVLCYLARNTRIARNAETFLKFGGMEAVLRLKARCAPSYPFLVSIIVRNCIDDTPLLSHVFDKTVRSYISVPQSAGGYSHKPKDFYDALNFLAPLSSRHPLVLAESVNRQARLSGSDILPMVREKKATTSTNTNTPSTPSTSAAAASTSGPSTSTLPVENNTRAERIIALMIDEVLHGEFEGSTRMLSQDKILNLLAEIVKSYPSLAIVIAETQNDGRSALHSLIDTYISSGFKRNEMLVPADKDSEAAGALKTLIAVISSGQNSTRAQELLVMDVKSALAVYSEKALKMRDEVAESATGEADCSELLQKISEVCSIIVTMCQSCPPHKNHQNSVMKLFHKKKMCADLVKTIHCLQLSSKDSLDTVNQILKTLDTLLEGSSGQSHTPIPRSFMDIVAGRGRARAEGLDDREVDQLLFGNDGFALDGEMRHLLRRLNEETNRGQRRAAAAAAAAAPAAAEPEEEEGSETSERERSDSPSEAGEEPAADGAEPANPEVRDDAVDVNMEQEVEGAPEEEVHQEEEVQAEGEGEEVDVEVDGEEEEEDDDGDDDDDDDDDDEEEEDDDEDQEDQDEQDETMMRVEQNPEPSAVRRLLEVEEDEDDDDDDEADEDGDSMEDDVARMDLEDDYFDLGNGVLADVHHHRMEEMIFPPTFGRPSVAAFADIFRDDFDFMPSYRERRPLTRGAQLSGVINEHPLMVRPPSDQDAARRVPTGYRAELLMHRAHLPAHASLHRQNAIRRTTEARELEAISRGIRMNDLPPRMVVRGGGGAAAAAVGTGEPITASLFDHIFEMRPSTGGFSSRINAYSRYGQEREERRDVRASQVPTCLDRLDAFTQSMEPISVRYIMIIVNSYLTTFHKAREAQLKKEADARAKAKKDAEERKKKAAAPAAAAVEPEGLAAPAATITTNTVSESLAGPSAVEPVAEPIAEPEPVVAEPEPVAEPIAEPEPEPVAEQVEPIAEPVAEPIAEQVEQAEPMETGEDDAPQQQPSSAAATAASSVAGVDELEDVPEGVDPAFLAALPVEMRAEVIRDWQRQQRAERASRAPAAAPAAPDAAGANAPPVVEPIDPVFLNALPLELQEEVLAEHERTVREAEESHRRALAPPQPPVEMDGAAVIASLPLNERAQVLAEMDDSELAGLPAEMQNEARRARAQHVEPNILRYHHLFSRGGRGPVLRAAAGRNAVARPAGVTSGGSTIGQHAGQAVQAPVDHPHLLDRESIVTLCLLYLVDNNRVPHTRLQKVLRAACVNQMTCEFIVWCLLALLDKASEANADDEEMTSQIPAWLDSISVSGVGHNERVLRISENAQKVSIHSMLAIPMCKNILDLLASIARAYPGNFLPAVLRQNAKLSDVPKHSPPYQQFWQLVQSNARFPKTRADWTAPLDEQLEECALGQLLGSLHRPTLAKTPLKEKVLKVTSQIMITLPKDTMDLLKIEDFKKPLGAKLENVIRAMTSGSCSADGLADGLTILSEAMRTFSDATSTEIYEHLFSAVSKLGAELLPQVDHLIVELDETQSSLKPDDSEPSTSATQPSTSTKHQLVVDTTGRTATGRFDGERLVIDGDQNTRLQMSSCKELQLPAVTVLTDKAGAQYALLSALQTLVKVRTHMKAIRKEKKEGGDGEQEQQEEKDSEPRISARLASLEPLWNSLSECLLRLGKASDPHAVLALQPAAEAFFLVHATSKPKTDQELDPDTTKLIEFAEKHRQVLNQALRQNNAVLSAGGPFAILTHFPKLLDFDVKRKYFRKELTKLEPSVPRYRRNDVSVQVSRNRVFSDSFRELFRLRPAEWKNRFYIIFQGEEGQDAGGLLREWFSVITREIFNPNYALFITAPGDMVTYMINKASYINPEHLDYFKFVGRLIAKSVFEHKYLDCYFTRAFYKHILNLPVRYQDLESEDPAFFKSLDFLLQNEINDLELDLTFATEVEEFGVRSVRDLKPNGRQIEVNDENKEEYVKLVCQMKMTGSIRKQLDAFLTGFYEIIPKDLISMFNEQELELLISGLPTVDIDDMAANTDYKGYQKTSSHIQWFWRALRSFEKEDKAKFLQFVTGTSKVPLQGFASLEGMNGVQKFSIHMDSRGGDRLPAAHTCFNQLDLPQYESYEKLRQSLLLAIRECTEGFGFA